VSRLVIDLGAQVTDSYAEILEQDGEEDHLS
jgi:hypothetical protein